MALTDTIGGFFAWVMKLKPVRVFFNYASNGGPLMASGLSFQGVFALFAALWVGFSILGIVIQGDIGLRTTIINSLGDAVPGLIKTSDGDGIVDPETLLGAGSFNWSAAIALVGLLVTALGFLASAREAVRRIFDVAADTTNFLILKVKDLGLAVGFGIAIIISAVLSASTTAALGFVLETIGVGSDSVTGAVLARIIGIVVVLVIDSTVLAGLFRVLAGVPIPRRHLLVGALLGGIGLGALKFLGGALLGGATRNPLLASFAVIAGILIFFNLVCQVILISASWIAVSMEDDGIAADPAAAAKRKAERERIAELERVAAEARRPKGLARLFHRSSDADAESTETKRD